MDADDVPEMTPERTDAIRQLLIQRLRDEPRERLRRARRRWLGGSVAGLLVIGGVATGASVVLNAAQVSNTSLVRCLSSTTPNSDGSYPGSSATISDGSGAGRVNDALDLCTQMWREGVLNDGSDPTAATHAPGTVPDALQVCVVRDGSAAVVPAPSPGICAALGMAPLKND